MYSGFLDTATDGEGTKPLASVSALAGEPCGAVFNNAPYPVQRLHVVLERGPAKQANLRHVRRTQSRFAAFALDRFDHRRLFTADIRAGAPSEMNFGNF